MDGSTLGLDGKVAVVTGGTRGLGRAIGAKLAASGCHVYLTYRHDGAAARSCAADLAGAKGVAVPVRADVTDPAAMAALLAHVRSEHGRLDVFVHNAASRHPMPAVGADPQAALADVSVAVAPLLRHAPALAELMAGGGRVVAVSSTGARRVVPAYVGQGLAKAALESAVRYLANDLGPEGIRVNAISPGPMRTLAGAAIAGARKVYHATERNAPLRANATLDAVGGTAVYLASDLGACTTGEVIFVDGGFHAIGMAQPENL